MNIHQFKLALNQLESSDWEHFERLCSAFLAAEFSSLRTMAHPSGDGGRDSELFASDAAPLVGFQYSVTGQWKGKIKGTVARLAEEHPQIKILIYMSNKVIGGAADTLRAELLEKGVMLDVRDQNWFLERVFSSSEREKAANDLYEIIGKPFLENEGVIERSNSPLNNNEAKAALLYLGLQWQDDITDKGLTKLTFDALVRSALRKTNSSNLMSRQSIKELVASFLPSSDRDVIEKEVDKALARLTKKFIRHHPSKEDSKGDSFCLTHEEHLRIVGRLAELEEEKAEFERELVRHCETCLEDVAGSTTDDLSALTNRIPKILESYLLKRGESFVSDINSGNLSHSETNALKDVIISNLSNARPKSNIQEHYYNLIMSVIDLVFDGASQATESYLRRLSNSYTLLSFLNQTPDVQLATKKLFSHGIIWLDTTVLLPFFAEQLKGNELRHLSKILALCKEAGIGFRVTSGVLQEINSHMNNALYCSRIEGRWQGRVPYLYCQFLRTGNEPLAFQKWISLFKGSERPEDDLAIYLKETLGAKIQDLENDAQKIPDTLRWAVTRLWTEAHDKRRNNKDSSQSDENIRVLIQHDVETYLGVVALRKEEQVSELGYKHWLLSFDRNAWEIRDLIKNEFEGEAPNTPLISLGYLSNSMAFGPMRQKISKADELTLPVILDIEMTDSAPHDILEIADAVRKDHEGDPDYVIKRKVRDAIDRARRLKK